MGGGVWTTILDAPEYKAFDFNTVCVVVCFNFWSMYSIEPK
jgi:hypothetical protein